MTISALPDTPGLRKSRGAFFTPPAIAEYLADWAVEGDPSATILDPTCGEAVFLDAAARKLRDLGASRGQITDQVIGVDLHEASVRQSQKLLTKQGLGGTFLIDDFFSLSTPDRLDAKLPLVDAVIGNPPYIRYQEHTGDVRKRARQAALEQGVRLSGLASSWAALMVHSSGFLKPDGRLAMVLPAELLTVGYAEPIRRWLRTRFGAVHLVMFDQLQFEDAMEKVVLLIARGTGGCNAFSLVCADDASDLPVQMFGPQHFNVAPAEEGKWSDFLLPSRQRQLFDRVVNERFVPLRDFGRPTLGTVTGANAFFTLNESRRIEYEIAETDLVKISPPGTKHLKGLSFRASDWNRLKADDESVWMLAPRDRPSPGLKRYLEYGQELGVPNAYKCRVREHWWRPPSVPTPQLFFTYMSHRFPRLVFNGAKAGYVNSMHGVLLNQEIDPVEIQMLPLLTLNSATMLGGEIFGRSYGGGVLKMEPSEAAILPVPERTTLRKAAKLLEKDKATLDRHLRQGLWTSVIKRVDEALLQQACGLSAAQAIDLHDAARALREHRMRREPKQPEVTRD